MGGRGVRVRARVCGCFARIERRAWKYKGDARATFPSPACHSAGQLQKRRRTATPADALRPMRAISRNAAVHSLTAACRLMLASMPRWPRWRRARCRGCRRGCIEAPVRLIALCPLRRAPATRGACDEGPRRFARRCCLLGGSHPVDHVGPQSTIHVHSRAPRCAPRAGTESTSPPPLAAQSAAQPSSRCRRIALKAKGPPRRSCASRRGPAVPRARRAGRRGRRTLRPQPGGCGALPIPAV